MIRPVTLAALLLLASMGGAAAQAWDTTGVSQPGWSLGRAMREFVRDLGGDLAGYFPARGEWEWVQTTRYPDGTMRRNVHRFPAAQTGQAIEPGGPVCHMFHSGDAVVEGTVISSGRGEGRWRRVGATRYVPPGMTARSPIFVEWRRENGRWVVAAVGEDGEYRMPLLGRNRYEAVRGPRGVPLRLPLPDSARLATGVDWHEHNIPIV
ncbi:MAG TPA: hypothetical protein VFS20_24880, partial [Longimicrobium sp.]|nr:hypothetical protein [Longimicrobium sp.]